MTASFYQQRNAQDTIRYVRDHVYDSRYQKEKDLCIARLLDHVDLKEARVLEVGCGSGVWTEQLARRGARITAVDVLPHLVESAESRLEQAGFGAQCSFLCGNVSAVVPADKRFDFVFFKDVMEHVEDDNALVAALRERMQEGAWMLVSTQNSRSANFLLEAFWERILKRNRSWMGWDETHVRFYTPKTLTRLLTANGLQVAHRNASYFVPYRWFTYRLGMPSREPNWAHALDHRSDDCWFSGLGWSMHVLARALGSPHEFKRTAA